MSPERVVLKTNTENNNPISPFLEVPRDKKGRIRWLILRQNPEQLGMVIESEARRILEKEQTLSKTVFARTGNQHLLSAIQRFYPGRISALKTNLGVMPDQKPKGYWTPEQIEKEALAFYEREGKLTQKLLKKKGRGDLDGAISQNYPGYMRSLKSNLDISQSRRPDGYWTPGRIEREAREFFEHEGQITQTLLARSGRGDLAGAINRYYPGKLVQLKQNLRIELSRKPDGYWTSERIEQEAREFYQREGRLGTWTLAKRGVQSLLDGIKLHYPGGIRQLRKALEITDIMKPAGYWTPEEIERQAKEFYEEEGNINLTLLAKGARKDLVSSIRKKYPGGIQALKVKLGIEIDQREPAISPEQADEQLRRLLKEN